MASPYDNVHTRAPRVDCQLCVGIFFFVRFCKISSGGFILSCCQLWMDLEMGKLGFEKALHACALVR